MEKKIYEHIFKTTFDALLDGWIVDTPEAGMVGLNIKNPPP